MDTMNLPYPLNLLIEAYLASGRDFPELDSDRYAGLNHLLGDLDERKREILMLKYKERRTWEDTASVYGVTRERVRQLGDKALHRIGENLQWVEDGYMITSGELDQRAKARLDVALVKREQEITHNRQYRFDDLDLSVRTMNCLRRNGVETVDQMMDTSEEDMRKWRGFGVYCLEDIRKARRKVRGEDEKDGDQDTLSNG